MKITSEMLQRAVSAACKEKLIPSGEVSTEAYTKSWDSIKRVLEAALEE